MQNGQGNGRNNHGLGRTQHNHGHGHQGIKNRDPKLNLKGKGAPETSMLRSEEKERQRQEARAEREKVRSSSSFSEEKNHAIFTAVQVGPTPDPHITDILGTYPNFSKHSMTNDLIGVDHQPPTPAPEASSHLHDPDNYPPTSGPTSARPPPHDFAGSYSHRPQAHGGNPMGVRPPKSIPSGLPHKTSHHHQKFVEEVKPSLKSGPGPGPGTRLPHSDRGSVVGSTNGGRSRPRSHERTVKDPTLQKIMSEMSDLKSPVSAIQQTPRPDHQSAFTFPTPAIPPSPKEAHTGFRLPHEPHLKSGKVSESRSLIPPKALKSILGDEVPLSEESDDEDGGGGPKVPGAIEVGAIGGRSSARQNHRASVDVAEESKVAPVSPLNNTDESSNSEDSSATDSESSSSEEEGKQSPSPPSPLAPSNAWNLETIFNQSNNNKEESLSRDVGPKEGKQETMPPSPHRVDQPAPPVVTTVPSQNHPRIHSESQAKSKTPYIPTSDESSDEEVRPPPKVQRSVVLRTPYYRTKQNSPSKNPTIIDPKLSSSSDEDELPPRPHRVAPKTKLILKCTRRAPPPPLPTSKPPPPKKNFKKRRDVESKSMEHIPSDRDSDSDSDTLAPRPVRNRASRRSPPPPAMPPAPSSARTNPKKLLNGDVSSATLTARKTSKSTPDADRHSRHTGRETKHDTSSSSQAKKPVVKEKEKVKRTKEPPPQQDPHALKKEKKEREQESKTERKKKSRHEGESERKSRGSERVTNSEPVVAPLPGSLSQRIEEPNLRLHLSPFNRRPPSSGSSGGPKASFLPPLQYDNGVPKLICSIPCNLIDKIPSNNSKGCIKDLKVNKEVLELRTSVGSEKGKGKEKKERTRNSKSPPKEEETKRMAICSIFYKKVQSSLEPEKIKRSDGTDAQDAKSPLVVPKVEEVPIKQEVKPLIKEEKFPIKEEKLPIKEEKPSSSKSVLDVPLKRNKSSSSMSPVGSVASATSHSHSKKPKKEKRKEKDHLHSRELEETALETEQTSSSTRRKRAVSPEPEVAVKRSGENSRESGRSSSKGASTAASGNALKKQKTSHDEETLVPHNQRENRISPHPRNSQRNASEERCGSALSNEASHTPYQGRAKLLQQQQQQQQQQQMHIPPHHYHQHVHQQTQQQLTSSQDKPEEESHLPPNAADTTEYCSLPSEHGVGVGCRGGDTRVASPLAPCCAHPLPVDPMTCGGQMYPPNVSSSPGPSMGCNSAMNQEATSAVPVYVSPFEKPMPEPLDDNTTYLNKAKELKHEADNEPHRILQTMKYLEAVLHFILTGESMECDPQSYNASFTMYNDTYKLIRYLCSRHVSTPIFKGQTMIDKIGNDAQSQRKSAILAILSLRCQSLLSLKIYDMQRPEIKETQRYVLEYIKTGGRQPPPAQSSSTPSATSSASVGGNTPCGNPSGSVWGGSQRSTANNSPSSLSPTPSPAGSVGSESSQTSSGYSTEEARQRGLHPGMGATPPQIAPTVSVNLDVHNNVTRHCQLTLNLSSAYDMWREADDSVFFNGVRDFFIELDRSIGPLTFQSSLRDLFKYVQKALVKLKEYDQ